MRHEDETPNGAHAAGGLGACLLALLSGLGRQADDVARVAARPVSNFGRTAHVNDFGRMTVRPVGNVGRVAAGHGDDVGRALLRTSDDTLPHVSQRPPRQLHLPDTSPPDALHVPRVGENVDPSDAVLQVLQEVVGHGLDAATTDRNEE